jgi:predicted nucleic acid-binding protein
VIVVDTNVVADLLLRTELTQAARAVLARDPEWAAPLQWRSEFRSVLVSELRGGLDLVHASQLHAMAEELFRGREFAVDSVRVFELAAKSGRSAYDCEFVAVARTLGVPLVTSDRQLLRSFPDTAVSLMAFGAAP